MDQKNLDKLITEALAIEAEEAEKAGALGYMGRMLVQATMPHSRIVGSEFERKNGFFILSMLAPSKIGLPYGSIPRLLMVWITTEAVRTKNMELVLGNTLGGFMSQLGLIPSGGRWGSITRLREQMTRLFSTSISCTYDDGKHWAIKNIQPISNANLWWEPKQPHQAALWESTLTLGQEFFDEITNKPVPIDIRAIKAIKNSSMSLDLYCWLTYRFSYLRRRTEIPWGLLQNQFGSNYADTKQGRYEFKRKLLNQLRRVQTVYDSAFKGVVIGDNGLILTPSRSHISVKK